MSIPFCDQEDSSTDSISSTSSLTFSDTSHVSEDDVPDGSCIPPYAFFDNSDTASASLTGDGSGVSLVSYGRVHPFSEHMDALTQSTQELHLSDYTVSSSAPVRAVQHSRRPTTIGPIDPSISERAVRDYIQQWALAQLRNNPISDPFQNAFSHFMWELSARHSGRSVCFSAVQKFVVEYQGQSMVYTLLAVLREEKDVSDQADPSGNWDRSFHFRFALDDEPHESSAVSNLLNLQVSARHFQDERSKSAIWTFGALSPGDRFVESSTFRWLKQQRLDVATKFGPRTAIDIASGDSNYPLSRLHQLRCRLTHAANSKIRPELLIQMDEEYRTSIEDDCEDWCFALCSVLANTSNRRRKLAIIEAQKVYMLESIKIESDGFDKAGYENCFHICPMDPCDHDIPTFAELTKRIERACLALTDHLKRLRASTPNKTMRRLSREIGSVLYLPRHAYALFDPEEKDLYHSVSFGRLNSARARITADMLPEPALIWNYLPAEIKSWAQDRRRESA